MVNFHSFCTFPLFLSIIHAVIQKQKSIATHFLNSCSTSIPSQAMPSLQHFWESGTLCSESQRRQDKSCNLRTPNARYIQIQLNIAISMLIMFAGPLLQYRHHLYLFGHLVLSLRRLLRCLLGHGHHGRVPGHPDLLEEEHC